MASLRGIYIVFSLALLLGLSACELKSKTTLYMERGLQFLDNTRELKAELATGVTATELGVIFDDKQQTTNLIIKLECPVDTAFFSNKILRLRGATKVKRKWKQENWELPLKAAQHKEHCYIFTPLKSKNAIIDSLWISLADANGAVLTPNEILASRVYTKQE